MHFIDGGQTGHSVDASPSCCKILLDAPAGGLISLNLSLLVRKEDARWISWGIDNAAALYKRGAASSVHGGARYAVWLEGKQSGKQPVVGLSAETVGGGVADWKTPDNSGTALSHCLHSSGLVTKPAH